MEGGARCAVRLLPGYPSGRAALAFSPLEEAGAHPCTALEMCNGRKDRDWRNRTRGLHQSPLIRVQSLEGSCPVAASPGFQVPSDGSARGGPCPGRSLCAEGDDRHQRDGSPLPSVTTSCGVSACGFILGGGGRVGVTQHCGDRTSPGAGGCGCRRGVLNLKGKFLPPSPSGCLHPLPAASPPAPRWALPSCPP